MKRWLIAGIFLLLGILFYFFIFGYGFTGLLFFAMAGIMAVFALLYNLRDRFPKTCRFFRRLLKAVLAIVLLLSVITGIWIGIQARGAEDPEAEYVIVLGAGVNGTTPSRSLTDRLLATEEYLQTYPDSIAVLSGGQGDNEDITEAACMYAWLTERGIAPERLLLEDKATNTEENLRFSLALIEEKTGLRPDCAAVISSEYHLARASLLAQNEGLTMLGYPAETENKLYFCNMFLREIGGVAYVLFQRVLG